MTALMRTPLQPLQNTNMVGELGGKGRRTSARLAEKEDVHKTREVSSGIESGTTSNTINKSRAVANGTAALKAATKRKITYDEEHDGFAFTRTRSKKTKTSTALQESAASEEQPPSKNAKDNDPPMVKKPQRKSFNSPATTPIADSAAGEKHRSTRNGAVHIESDLPALQVKKRRKPSGSREPLQGQGIEPADQRSSASEHPNQGLKAAPTSDKAEVTFDTTKIALPFADTPIIRRNKEMRRGASNGSRRSSLGLRGRRASSLIDAGKSNALPHDEVESAEFYKHIASEGLSEPRRMQQLLMWCGARAMADKPSFTSEDGNARLAAREIQSQLLKDFSTKSSLSDWFDRKEITPPDTIPKPNPKNLTNLAKIEELEQQISRLQAESQAWQSLLRPPLENSVQLPALSSNVRVDQINADLLPDPTQKTALSLLESDADPGSSLTATASARLEKVNESLEFEIDQFGNHVHALSAYKGVAEHIADETLGLCARILDQRNKEGIRLATKDDGGEPTTRDVLRSLSRVIDR